MMYVSESTVTPQALTEMDKVRSLHKCSCLKRNCDKLVGGGPRPR